MSPTPSLNHHLTKIFPLSNLANLPTLNPQLHSFSPTTAIMAPQTASQRTDDEAQTLISDSIKAFPTILFETNEGLKEIITILGVIEKQTL